MKDDERIPGFHDPMSMPQEERIQKLADCLAKCMNLQQVAELAASSLITLRDFQQAPEIQEYLRALDTARNQIDGVFDLADAGLLIAERSTRRLMSLLEKDIERKSKLSNAGTKGAGIRSGKLIPLKQWAIQESARLKGTPTEKARKLMQSVPLSISNLATDPERIMREAIRESEKSAKLAPRIE